LGNKMNIRKIESRDLKEVIDVRAATCENQFSREELLSIGITEESVAEMLRNTHCGWLCETENRIVGFAIGDRTTGELWVIAVLPELEGKGIGSRLLEKAEEWLVSCGHRELWLWTSSDRNKRAFPFYESRDWVVSEVKSDIVYMRKKAQPVDTANASNAASVNLNQSARIR
jgi:GNAT superfamily N-acetyltransferase